MYTRWVLVFLLLNISGGVYAKRSKYYGQVSYAQANLDNILQIPSDLPTPSRSESTQYKNVKLKPLKMGQLGIGYAFSEDFCIEFAGLGYWEDDIHPLCEMVRSANESSSFFLLIMIAIGLALLLIKNLITTGFLTLLPGRNRLTLC